jgi:hypothetical protein
MRSIRLLRVYETPQFKSTAAELLIDDNRKVVLPVDYEYVDPGREILEEGIEEIELAASSSFNRAYKPIGGKVKWFRDELGQTWVKLRVYKGSEEYDHVAPADRVVHVRYPKVKDERTP